MAGVPLASRAVFVCRMKPASASACLGGRLPEARPVTDPILTMDLAVTAVRTGVSAGHSRP
jgi:hypothetical protein